MLCLTDVLFLLLETALVSSCTPCGAPSLHVTFYATVFLYVLVMRVNSMQVMLVMQAGDYAICTAVSTGNGQHALALSV